MSLSDTSDCYLSGENDDDLSDYSCNDIYEQYSHSHEYDSDYSQYSSTDNEASDDELTWVWTDIPHTTITPLPVNKIRQNNGPKKSTKNAKTLLNCFQLFINRKMIEKIVEHTNEHGMRDPEWRQTNMEELQAWMGLRILAGRYHQRRESIDDIWLTDLSTSFLIFHAVMSKERFKAISRHIRFDSLSTRKERKKNNDRLAPIRELSEDFFTNCQKAYDVGPHTTIYERIIPFKGKCSFKICKKVSETEKYGIKMWSLRSAENWYFCNGHVYLGKSSRKSDASVVKDLTDYWGKKSGRNVTIPDNSLTCLPLAEDLYAKNITLLGAVRKNAGYLPRIIPNLRKTNLYDSNFKFSEHATLVEYVCADKPKKSVVVLSTSHRDRVISSEDNPMKKPDIILNYEKTKNGIRRLEKSLGEFTCRRASKRWPLVLFDNFIDIAASNAIIIHAINNPNWCPKVDQYKIGLRELGMEHVMPTVEKRAKEIEKSGFKCLDRRLLLAIESTGRTLNFRKPEFLDSNEPKVKKLRGTCYRCIPPKGVPKKNMNKHGNTCVECKRYICPDHTVPRQCLGCYVNNVL